MDHLVKSIVTDHYGHTTQVSMSKSKYSRGVQETGIFDHEVLHKNERVLAPFLGDIKKAIQETKSILRRLKLLDNFDISGDSITFVNGLSLCVTFHVAIDGQTLYPIDVSMENIFETSKSVMAEEIEINIGYKWVDLPKMQPLALVLMDIMDKLVTNKSKLNEVFYSYISNVLNNEIVEASSRLSNEATNITKSKKFLDLFSYVLKNIISDKVNDFLRQYVDHVPRQVFHDIIDEIYVSEVMDE